MEISLLAIVLTIIPIIFIPIFYFLLFRSLENIDIFSEPDWKQQLPIMFFGSIGVMSFFLAIFIWITYGITEYQKPSLDISEALTSLESFISEAVKEIEILKSTAIKYENQMAESSKELSVLKDALVEAKRGKEEIRLILTGPHWPDRIWSFFIGVASSIAFAFLFIIFRRLKKRK